MPGAARLGDPGVVHCSGYVIARASTNVFVNGRGAARVGDTSSVHLVPGRRCSPHVAAITRGSRSVFVNGRPAARVGDGLAGCTVIAAGSTNVNIGG